MLNTFPPGGAPPAVNRQLPQNLTVPGLQQQAAGNPNPYQNPMTLGAPAGLPAQTSGIATQLPGQMGMPMGMPGAGGAGGMLGMPPPGGATPSTPGGSQVPGLQGTPEGQMQSMAQALNPSGGAY